MEKTRVAVTGSQCFINRILCGFKKECPHFQHTGFLTAVDSVRVGGLYLFGPADIPVSQMTDDGKSLLITGVEISMGKSHD